MIPGSINSSARLSTERDVVPFIAVPNVLQHLLPACITVVSCCDKHRAATRAKVLNVTRIHDLVCRSNGPVYILRALLSTVKAVINWNSAVEQAELIRVGVISVIRTTVNEGKVLIRDTLVNKTVNLLVCAAPIEGLQEEVGAAVNFQLKDISDCLSTFGVCCSVVEIITSS